MAEISGINVNARNDVESQDIIGLRNKRNNHLQ